MVAWMLVCVAAGCQDWTEPIDEPLLDRAPVAGTVGWRLFDTRKDRVAPMLYLGVEARTDGQLGDVDLYIGFKLGASVPTVDVEAQRNPEAEDEWGYLAAEVEWGVRYRLLDGEDVDLWTSLGMPLTVIRAAQHHAGPSGNHNHFRDDHETTAFGGVGAILRLGSAHSIGPLSVEPGVGVGLSALGGGNGTAAILEFSLKIWF